MAFEGLILDYGNVLSCPQPENWCESVASHVGVSTDAFRDAYWRHRHLYDAGLAATEYWRRVLESLGCSHPASDVSAVIERLVATDVASWTRYRDEVWNLVESFRGTGGRTAFLSNGVAEAMAQIRVDRHLPRWFDVVVVSCEVGVSKPDPAIFQLCLSQLRVEPGEALFVDDRIENIEGAASLGIRTFHFVGPDAVSRLVRSVRSSQGRQWM